MKIIVPYDITPAMIKSGTTVTEPAASETAWVSGGTYVAGDMRIRAETHRVYKCVQDITGGTTAPEDDPLHWTDFGPTLRWAPFDYYKSTKSLAPSANTYILEPGYFNALALYGVQGQSVDIHMEADGVVYHDETVFMVQDPDGWYEYLFLPVRSVDKLTRTDLPIKPGMQLTVTVHNTDVVAQAGLGTLIVGDLFDFTAGGEGGTQWGAEAQPVTYSYIKTDEFGDTEIVKRRSATDLRCSVLVPTAQADVALAKLQSLLDIPVACIPTTAKYAQGLSIYGLITTAPVRWENNHFATIEFTVKGLA